MGKVVNVEALTATGEALQGLRGARQGVYRIENDLRAAQEIAFNKALDFTREADQYAQGVAQFKVGDRVCFTVGDPQVTYTGTVYAVGSEAGKLGACYLAQMARLPDWSDLVRVVLYIEADTPAPIRHYVDVFQQHAIHAGGAK